MKGSRFAALVLAGVFGLGSLACSKKRTEVAVKPFSCEGLQLRAETCSEQMLSLVLEDMKARAARDVKDDSQLQFKMFKGRLMKKLRQKKLQKQCKRFSVTKGQDVERRMATMKACYAKQGCPAFAKCLLGP